MKKEWSPKEAIDPLDKVHKAAFHEGRKDAFEWILDTWTKALDKDDPMKSMEYFQYKLLSKKERIDNKK